MEILTTQVKHAKLLADYYTSNSLRFARWHPLVRQDHNSIESWTKRLEARERDYQDGRAVHFLGLEEGKVVGTCSLTNIVYSPGLYCAMGYSVDADYEGKGYMSGIVRHVVDYAFNNLRLNRISANYMPVNERSARLLEKMGFEKEGFAKRYLYINGRWEDHVLTALLNPKNSK
ncbi:GNAT family N-acetyltransferase [Gammaproteobacteria bacterium]|nr:GNAT family N-acetyltransferase [Gammaproteobacteria bacterium]